MSGPDPFDRVLEALGEAMFDDALWRAASGLIDELCGAKGNFPVYGDGTTDDDIEIFLARFCFRGQRNAEVKRLYFDVYHALDERVPRLRRLPDAEVVHVSALYTEEEMKTSVACNEALPLSDTRDSLNVRLDGPNGSRIVWVAGEPVEGAGWSSARIEAIERRGRIVDTNDRAAEMLRRTDGLSDPTGKLHAARSEDDSRLENLLAGALPRFGDRGVSGSMNVRRPSSLPELALHVIPVTDREVDYRPRHAAALVLIVDPAARARTGADVVRSVPGLTPAEAEVALLLAQGRTLRQIARTTARGYHTVRTHLRHIFAKLGVSRQLDVAQTALARSDQPADRDRGGQVRR